MGNNEKSKISLAIVFESDEDHPISQEALDMRKAETTPPANVDQGKVSMGPLAYASNE